MSVKIFWICLIISVCLLVGSFLLPPMGVIDNSVLAAVGWLFGFTALGVLPDALKKGLGAKIRKGDTEIELTQKRHEHYE